MVIASAENVLSDASAAQETTKTQYETQLANLDAQINTLFSDNSFLRRKLEVVTKDFDSERRRVKSLERELQKERERVVALESAFARPVSAPAPTGSSRSEAYPWNEPSERDEVEGGSLTLAQFEQSRALPASSEESKLRKLVLGMRDQLDAKDSKVAALTQSHAMVEAQLAASRHETVNALLLLQTLSNAEVSIEQRREKMRMRTGRRRGVPAKGGEDAEDSRLFDSLDISDLQTSPVPQRRSPAPHTSTHTAKERELKEVTAMVELGVGAGGVRARLEEVHEIWQAASDGVLPLSELMERLAQRVAAAVECIEGVDEACEEEKNAALGDLEAEAAAEREARRRLQQQVDAQAQELARAASDRVLLPGLSKQAAEVEPLRKRLLEREADVLRMQADLRAAEGLQERYSQLMNALKEHKDERADLVKRLEEQTLQTKQRDESLQMMLKDYSERVVTLEREQALRVMELELRHEQEVHDRTVALEEQLFLFKESVAQGDVDLETLKQQHAALEARTAEAHAKDTADLHANIAALKDQVCALRASLEEQIGISVSNFNLQAVVSAERDNAVSILAGTERERSAVAARAQGLEGELAAVVVERDLLVAKLRSSDASLQQTVAALKADFNSRRDVWEQQNGNLEAELFQAQAQLSACSESLRAALEEQELLRQKARRGGPDSPSELKAAKAREDQHLLLRDAQSRLVETEREKDALLHAWQLSSADLEAAKVSTADLKARLTAAEQQLMVSRSAEARAGHQLGRVQAELASASAKLEQAERQLSDVTAAHSSALASLAALQRRYDDQAQGIAASHDEHLLLRQRADAAERSAQSVETAQRIAKGELGRVRVANEMLARDKGQLKAEVDTLTLKLRQLAAPSDAARDSGAGRMGAAYEEIQQMCRSSQAQHTKDQARITELTRAVSAAIGEKEAATAALMRVESEVASMWVAENKTLSEQVGALQALVLEKDAALVTQAGQAGAAMGSLESELAAVQAQARSAQSRADTFATQSNNLAVERDQLRARCLELETHCADLSKHVATLTDFSRETERDFFVREGRLVASEAALTDALQQSRLQSSSLDERASALALQVADSEAQLHVARQRLEALASANRLLSASEAAGLSKVADLQQRLAAAQLDSKKLAQLEQIHDLALAARGESDAHSARLLDRVAALETELRKARDGQAASRAAASSAVKKEADAESASAAATASERERAVLQVAVTQLEAAAAERDAALASALQQGHHMAQRLKATEAATARAVSERDELQQSVGELQQRVRGLLELLERQQQQQQQLEAQINAPVSPDRDQLALEHSYFSRHISELSATTERLAKDKEALLTERVQLQAALAQAQAQGPGQGPGQGARRVVLPAASAREEERRRLSLLKVPALKELLRARGLPVSGLKSELILRLLSSSPSHATAAAAASAGGGGGGERDDEEGLNTTVDEDERGGDEGEDDEEDEDHPRVIFSFESEAEEEDPRAARRATLRANRARRLAELHEANEALEKENEQLSSKVAGLLQVNRQLNEAHAVSAAGASWALKAAKVGSYDDDAPGPPAAGAAGGGLIAGGRAANPMLSPSTPLTLAALTPSASVSASVSASALTPAAAGERALLEDLSREQLLDHLLVARRNAKASTAAAHRMSSDAQQQLRVLQSELADMTSRYTEVLRQNESLSRHLQTAEEDYSQASQALIDSADRHRKAQAAKLDALQRQVEAARDHIRRTVSRARAERERHREELSALKEQLRAACEIAGLPFSQDEDDAGLESSDDEGEGSGGDDDSFTSDFAFQEGQGQGQDEV